MKNKHLFWIVSILLIVTASCKKDPIIVSGFSASQGTYVGVVHLVYEPVADVEAYEIQRKNPKTNVWEKICYVKSFVPDKVYDDYGINLLTDPLLAGQVYEYRMRTFDDKKGTNPWSATVSGYIFAPSPRIAKVKYVPDTIPGNDGIFTFTIKDKLPTGISNLTDRSISLYRAKATTSIFTKLSLNNYLVKGNDSTIYVTCMVNNTDAPYDYKLEISYKYTFAQIEETGSNLNGGKWNYLYQSLVITDDDIVEGGDSTATVTYNMLSFNEINLASTGGKNWTIMCKDGTTAYLGYLDNYSATGKGMPVIMKNAGSSWVNASGTLPSNLLSDVTIGNYDFTVSAGIMYLAALGSDSIYIYKNNGTWSANMTTAVLYGSAITKEINIAVVSNELYASIMDKDTLKVYKYQGTEWVQAGADVATGFLIDLKLQELDGTLYLSYEEAKSGSTETTINIKHLNGSSWNSDLQWTKDAASDFDVIKAGSNLYFKCLGQSVDFLGGVYKVTSATTVTNLFAEGNLMHTPMSITADASGNIIASVINGSTALNFQLGVYIYEGSAWKKVTDDYSEVSISGKAAGIQAIGNDIHFVYGLKSSKNGVGDATILKAKKYSK
jgi:hypothetical protein